MKELDNVKYYDKKIIFLLTREGSIYHGNRIRVTSL